MNETIRSKKELFDSIPPFSGGVEEALAEARQGFDRKIVVLDDDPTGIQTVHDVSVIRIGSRKVYCRLLRKRPPCFLS